MTRQSDTTTSPPSCSCTCATPAIRQMARCLYKLASPVTGSRSARQAAPRRTHVNPAVGAPRLPRRGADTLFHREAPRRCSPPRRSRHSGLRHHNRPLLRRHLVRTSGKTYLRLGPRGPRRPKASTTVPARSATMRDPTCRPRRRPVAWPKQRASASHARTVRSSQQDKDDAASSDPCLLEGAVLTRLWRLDRFPAV